MSTDPKPRPRVYLLNDTQEGLWMEEGSQPEGGDLGQPAGEDLVQEDKPQAQVLDPLPQRPVRGRG